MSEPAEFSTQDLILSAYLVVSHHAPQEVRRNGGDRADFIFADSPQLRTDVNAFYGCKGCVEPQHFAQIIRSLRGVARFGYQSPTRERQTKEKTDAAQPSGR